MRAEQMMVNERQLLSARRRMVVQALGLRPRDLKQFLGLNGAAVSVVLAGQRRLTAQQRVLLWELARKHLDDLFG